MLSSILWSNFISVWHYVLFAIICSSGDSNAVCVSVNPVFWFTAGACASKLVLTSGAFNGALELKLKGLNT